MVMSSNNNNPPKEGAMKEYTFMGGDRQPIIVQYNEDGKVLKITASAVEHIEPKLTARPGQKNNYMTEEFIPFVVEEWEQYMAKRGCAQLYWVGNDGYYKSVYPVNAPVCRECGIFPVFEYRGFNQNGVEFTQGWAKKCTGCDETRTDAFGDDIVTGDDISIVYHPTIEEMSKGILGVIKQIIADDDENKDEGNNNV